MQNKRSTLIALKCVYCAQLRGRTTAEREIYERPCSSEHGVVSGSSPRSKIQTTQIDYNQLQLCFRSPSSFLSNARCSVLGRYDKQMSEMPVAGRWSGIKPRSSDYQPAGNQSRPRKGFCVGLAATGSTACNANVIQKTRRRKKSPPQIALIGSQRRFPVKWKNSSTVLFSALKLKQVGNKTNERLSAQGLPANQREAVSLFRGNGRPVRELKILTVLPIDFLL